MEELAKEFPELAKLLDMEASQVPVPLKEPDEKDEDTSFWPAPLLFLRAGIAAFVLLFFMIVIPFRSDVPTSLRIADAVALAVLVTLAVLVIRRCRRE